MDRELFQTDPRDYALQLVEESLTSADNLLSAALGHMSYDEVRSMLDANELSPRFDEDEDEGICNECEELEDECVCEDEDPHTFGCTQSQALGGPGTPGACQCDKD